MISSKSPALWRKPLWRFWAGEKRSRDEGNQTVAVLRRISPEKKKRKSFKNVLHHPHRDSISELKGHAASDPGTHLGKDDEKDLLQNFWQRLRLFTKERGIPTYVTWNGLGFTFPFLIERSTVLGVEPSCILPRARFQPWKHLDLFAELADYDPHRFMSLESRLALWGLNGNGNGHHFGDHDVLTEQWRKGNPKPVEENLTLILEALHRILNRVAPCFLEARNNGH